MSDVDLELLEARWRTGRILTGELARVARELLEAGHDSPSAAALASSPEGGRPDARSLFESALAELGGGAMTDAQAALVLARLFARELLAGTIPAEQTARGISALRWKGGPAVDAELDRFSDLEARYETARAAGPLAGPLRLLLDRRVRAAARSLLAG